MAANWLRGWMNSTRRPDKRTTVRRQELRIDALEDRTVPATAVSLTDATSAPPLAGHDSETAVAINPTNTNNIVGFANYLGTLFGTTPSIAGVSQDGNLTYNPSTIPLTGAAPIGDPVVRAFSDGRILLSEMEFDGANAGTIGMFTALSSDGGLTWTKGTVTPVGSGDDKQEIAIGPDINNLGQERAYFTFHRGNVIFASSSVDGINWTAPVQVSAGGGNINSHLTVDSTGVIICTWDNFATAGQSNIQLSRSTDGGVTWSPEITIATTSINAFQDTTQGGSGGRYLIPAQPNRGIWTFPTLATDRSGGAFDGRIYLAFTDQDRDEPAGAARHNDLGIYLMFSDDQGTTWSTPTKLDDGGTTNSVFFPNIDVDQSTGNVAVGWYDGRNAGTQNQLMEYWGTVSDPGGESFGANFMVSQGQSNMVTGGDGGNDYGDYSGVSFTQGVLAYAWSDNSNSSGTNPEGAGGNSDLYIRTFQVGGAVGGRDLVAFDLSRSMVALYGLDINSDGVVNHLDDFNEKGLEGSLIDAELFDFASNQGGEAGIIAFGRRAETLNMTPDGRKFTSTALDSDGNGVTDVVETLQSLTKGGGGYFGTVDVGENPTNYESVLANILLYASPGDNVTIYTDGAGRLDANSASLQAVAQAGITVNVVIVGPYQSIAPTDGIEQIATATGGSIRRLNNFKGRPSDGGFQTVVTGGGTGGTGNGGGSLPGGNGGGSGGSTGGSGGSGDSGSGGGSGGSSGGSGGGAGASGGATDGGNTGGDTGSSGGAGSASLMATMSSGSAESNSGGANVMTTNSGATTTTKPVVTTGPLGLMVDGKPAFVPFRDTDGLLYKWVFMRNSLEDGPLKMRVGNNGIPLFTRPTVLPTQPGGTTGGTQTTGNPVIKPSPGTLPPLALPSGTSPTGTTGQGGTVTSSDPPASDPPAGDTPSSGPAPTTGDGKSSTNTGATSGLGAVVGSGSDGSLGSLDGSLPK